ncbi:hypothetical protein AB0M39_10570 [Streptomyces sp. NPDC051907]|uniref:hypothetical protein n=1 Tax=Streptomyces sp. NPDC051907 TaxID=3155284 RepID=UPI0034135984
MDNDDAQSASNERPPDRLGEAIAIELGAMAGQSVPFTGVCPVTGAALYGADDGPCLARWSRR